MQVKSDKLSDTKVKLHITIEGEDLKHAKQHAVEKLSKNVKVQGFREGKAPAHLAEKAIDQQALQNEFIDHALGHAYDQALKEANVRPVLQPKVELTKFVPFTTVEFTAEVETLGKIVVGDYKMIKKTKPKAEVTADEVDQVIKNMQRQLAEKKDVTRAAKLGDEVVLDFVGTDDKGEKLSGASGTGYPLTLGSKSFIPGFEEELVGLKASEEKTFDIVFPKDYGAKAMAGRKVTFACTVTAVKEIVELKVDEDFVKKVNPTLKDVKELKEDIKKQLMVEKQRQTDRDFEADVINELNELSKVDLPEGLIEEQSAAILNELNQNLAYRGMTMKEYLENAGMTEEEQRKKEILPEAERRLKAGLILTEIADMEKIDVSPEELDIRIKVLKGQYASDPQMQAELDNPENRRDVAARLLTEKTIAKLMTYVTGTKK